MALGPATTAGLLAAFVATVILALFVPQPLFGQWFVSSRGDDLNPGTETEPFRTIFRGHEVASAGDTIYLRGGTYDSLLSTITLSKSGSPTSRYFLVAYPGERPQLDFSLMPISGGNRGIQLSGSYWHIFGIDVVGAGDNGMHVSGSNNIIEFCTFSRNSDTGLQLDNGAANNQVVNCDSYHNADLGQGSADGFAAKLDVGSGNSFVGCRAWENSDDGYDGYLRPSNDVTTTLDHCWIFRNGYLADGSASTGNGNGIKLGGSDDRTLRHNVTLRNCLAFDNRVKGFDQNNNRGSMTLLNCTGYRNGTNYSISGVIDTGQTLTLVNCVALGDYGVLGSFALQQTNSWLPSFTAAPDDFQSTDTTGVRGPRTPDGRLPDIAFLHLTPGSDLIDSGTDVGIPFNGMAPDLGAFETEPSTSVTASFPTPAARLRLQHYPNPFNAATTMLLDVPVPGTVTIRIYDLLGRLVCTLESNGSAPGTHLIRWDGTDAASRKAASGVYIADIRIGQFVSTVKLHLMR